MNLASLYEKTDSFDEALSQNKKVLELIPSDAKTMAKVKELEKKIEERN